MRTLAIVSFCVLASADSAWAGWEYTEWGMSVKKVQEMSGVEVRRASHEARVMKRVSPGSNILAYVKDYSWQGHRFEVRFGFDDYAKLNRVFLLEGEDRFDALGEILTGVYGEPVSWAASPLPCRLWIDRTRGDHVRLRRVGSTIVEHMPAYGEPAMHCWGSQRAARE